MNPMQDNEPKVKVATRNRARLNPVSVLLLVAIVVLLISGAVSGI